jgi:hypothetical protein
MTFKWHAANGGSAASPSIEEKMKVLADLWEIKVPTLTSQKKSKAWIDSSFRDVWMGHPLFKNMAVIAAVNRCATQKPDVGGGE